MGSRVRLTMLAVFASAVVAMLYLAGVASALTPSEKLEQTPFQPTDVSLFDPAVYHDTPALVPARDADNDEATLRSQLKALLDERFGSGSAQVRWGLEKFDAASTKAIVPHPRLRAALVSLKGTVGAPAIDGALSGTYSTLDFGTPPATGAVAQGVFQDGQDAQIVFNERFRYEDFKLIAPILAHETLHRDPASTLKEELIANSIDALVYGQFLMETPSLATSGTELARIENTQLLARLNTRDASGKLRLVTSQGNIFPSGNFVPYFAAPFEPPGDSTPGNAVLKAEVRNVVGSTVTLPKRVNFDDDTALLLDSKQAVFTPERLIELATILKLDTSGSTTAA
jgi:hypothetical protein